MAVLYQVVFLILIVLSCCQAKPTNIKINTTDLIKEEQQNQTMVESQNHSVVEIHLVLVESRNQSLEESQNQILGESIYNIFMKLLNQTLEDSENQTLLQSQNQTIIESQNKTLLESQNQTLVETRNQSVVAPSLPCKNGLKSQTVELKKENCSTVEEIENKNLTKLERPLYMWVILPIGEDNGKNESLYILAAGNHSSTKLAETQESTKKDMEKFLEWKAESNWEDILDKIGAGALGSLLGK